MVLNGDQEKINRAWTGRIGLQERILEALRSIGLDAVEFNMAFDLACKYCFRLLNGRSL